MIIDIHGHISPPEALARFPMPPSLADIDGMLEQKAEVGIELTIVGSPVGAGAMMRVPGVDNYAQTAEQLRRFHGWLGETVEAHRDQLRAYVYTNPLGDEASLQAAADTLRDGPFVGFIANTSVAGQYLDSDRADAFFAMVSDLNVPVLLHPPAEPVGSGAVGDFRLVEQVGRFCDVTIGMAAIIFAGWLDRYPNLKLIAGTGGGAVSLLAAKLDLAHQPQHWVRRPDGAPGGGASPGPPVSVMAYENRISQPPSAYFDRLYVDTAFLHPLAQQANLELFGARNVLFGTDSPPLVTPLRHALDMVQGLPVSAAEKQEILSGNAQQLFKL